MRIRTVELLISPALLDFYFSSSKGLQLHNFHVNLISHDIPLRLTPNPWIWLSSTCRAAGAERAWQRRGEGGHRGVHRRLLPHSVHCLELGRFVHFSVFTIFSSYLSLELEHGKVEIDIAFLIIKNKIELLLQKTAYYGMYCTLNRKKFSFS